MAWACRWQHDQLSQSPRVLGRFAYLRSTYVLASPLDAARVDSASRVDAPVPCSFDEILYFKYVWRSTAEMAMAFTARADDE